MICKPLFFCIILLFISSTNFGQLSIRVLDEEGKPMQFVEVYTDNFNFSSITNQEGIVILPEKINNHQTVIFNFLGYQQVSKTKKELQSNSQITMSPGLILDEVLMVGRTDNQSRDLPGKVESIDTKIFKLTNPQTSADALAQHADVYIQKSQMGGGSPIVRGFEANKVLLVLDGVRLNNAIYRNGHLQNAITVDPAMLERLEVLYGPGSLVYGSEAIGGVVHFRSKNPRLNFSEDESLHIFGNASTRFTSANQEKTGHFDLNVGGSKFGSLSSVSFSDFGDLKTGNKRSKKYPDFGKRYIYAHRENGVDHIKQNENPNIQIGTAYSQLDILQKFLYQASDDVRWIANIQFSNSSNIPRYDALSEKDGEGLSFSEWYYGPQKRFFSSIRTDIRKENAAFDKLIIIAAYQKIDEDRIDRQFGSLNLDRQEEDVKVASITADMHKYLNLEETFEVNYGVDYSKNYLSSTAFRTNISTGETSNSILTRYPSGGGQTENVAIYALFKKSFPILDIYGGVRYSNNSISITYNSSDNLPWPQEYYDGVNSRNSAVSWSIGTTYDVGNNWKLSSQFSSAYRSPNIDDLAKIRVKVDEISVPNLDLKPETSINCELIVSKSFQNFLKFSTTAFATSLKNAIVRDNFTLPDGTSFLIDEGDTLITVANINADKAEVVGISFNSEISLNKHFSFASSINYVRGISFDKNESKSPLSHIPPIYGKVDVRYLSHMHQASLTYRFNGVKPVSLYGGTEDNIESATPDGTPAWSTLNFYYQINVNQNLSLSLGVENILDVHYRPFASGVSASGRNFILGINGTF